MTKKQAQNLFIDILTDLAGGILIAVGVYNFAANAQFPMVGFNGIALIFYHLFGAPIGITAMLLNIPVAIACFRILGRQFFIRSIRTIILTSIIMDVVAPIFPVYHGDRMLAAICCGVLSWLRLDLYERVLYRRFRFHYALHQDSLTPSVPWKDLFCHGNSRRSPWYNISLQRYRQYDLWYDHQFPSVCRRGQGYVWNRSGKAGPDCDRSRSADLPLY